MFDNLINKVNDMLSQQLSQHVRWRASVSRDVCYVGKVLKIVATNYSKDDPEPDNRIDARYNRESLIICIPIQNHSSVEEFNDYLAIQISLAIQKINNILI